MFENASAFAFSQIYANWLFHIPTVFSLDLHFYEVEHVARNLNRVRGYLTCKQDSVKRTTRYCANFSSKHLFA